MYRCLQQYLQLRDVIRLIYRKKYEFFVQIKYMTFTNIIT